MPCAIARRCFMVQQLFYMRALAKQKHALLIAIVT